MALGSAGRAELSMNQKSLLISEVRNREGFPFQKPSSSPSKEKSHEHPEAGWGGPKDQLPSCTALLGREGGWWCCPPPGAIPWLSWVGGEDGNSIWQVRPLSPGKNLSLSLGTQLHLVELLLAFTSPGPAPNFAACHAWHCSTGMTHQDQRHLEVAVSGCA